MAKENKRLTAEELKIFLNTILESGNLDLLKKTVDTFNKVSEKITDPKDKKLTEDLRSALVAKIIEIEKGNE